LGTNDPDGHRLLSSLIGLEAAVASTLAECKTAKEEFKLRLLPIAGLNVLAQWNGWGRSGRLSILS
jgi:heme A synthase